MAGTSDHRTGVGLGHWGEQFPETRWSMLITERDAAEDIRGDRFATLCSLYWYPLYAYVRRRGYSTEDAQDLTQGFFSYLLGGGSLTNADRARGRFRSYLLGAMNHFLSDRRKYQHAEKRGGGQSPISIEAEAAELRFRKELADEVSPEKLFDRGWAMTVLDEARQRLEEEMKDRGKAEVFSQVAEFLSEMPEPGAYAAIAARVEMKEDALRKFVSRMRARFKELLREQVRATVSEPEEIDDEIGYLLSSFS